MKTKKKSIFERNEDENIYMYTKECRVNTSTLFVYTLLNIIPQIQHLDCVENEHFFLENERGGKKVQGIYDMRVW